MSDPTSTEQGIPAPEGPTDLIETDYEIGQDNIEGRSVGPFGLDIHNPVFAISGLTIVAFVASMRWRFQERRRGSSAAARLADLDLRLVLPVVGQCLRAASACFLIVSPWGACGSAARMRRPTTVIPAGSRCCSPPAWASG
jgi:hypothetical protein